MRYLAFVIGLSLVPTQSAAHPVIFKGGVEPQGQFTEHLQDLQLTHSLTPRDAVAMRGWRYDPDGGPDRLVLGVQYNRLLKRWNAPSSQANLYLSLGGGVSDFRGQTGVAGLAALQADWETRRWFTAAKAELVAGNGFTHGLFTGRLGWAPYETDYDSLAVWLMLQVRYITDTGDSTAITPFIRLFQDPWLIEAGVSLDGDPMFNFMLHF